MKLWELEKKFDINGFKDPDNRYYPIYSWVWNDKMDKELVKAQLDEMYDRNVRQVYVIPLPKEFRPYTMVTDLQPEYLSDEYFELFKFAVDYASEKGILFGLYDEAGWPSGNANFTVMAHNDDYKLCAVYEGEVRTFPTVADNSNREGTELFIELTHDKYRDHLGESFDKIAPYIFTDEPDIRNLPYTKSIIKAYKEKYGKELELDKILKMDDVDFKIKYRDLAGEVFRDNYFKPIKKWCEDNGIYSAGHLNGEDETIFATKIYGYHQPMRLLRQLHIPGVDVIWRQIYKDHKKVFFPRLASSAAEQVGTGLSISESMSVFGSPTYEDMRYVTGFQYVRGINIMNYMLIMANEDGYYAIRQRPSMNAKIPGGEQLKDFNKYVSRLSYVLSVGDADTKCALYMPMRDLWAEDEDTESAAKSYDDMGYAIEDHHGQFDIVDDDLILECDDEKLRNGMLSMGKANYSVLYIPADKYMTDKVKSRLDIFKAGGGEIIRSENMKFYPVADVQGDNGNLRVHKRVADEDELYLFFNESTETVKAKINLGENVYYIDAESGNVYTVEDEEKFESGEMKVFVKTRTNLSAKKRVSAVREIAELTEFKMKKNYSFIVDKSGVNRVASDDEAQCVKLGDWKEYNGEYFSGECEYTTHFKKPENVEKCVLSLGTVNYSCRVLVNGKEIGAALMPPYDFIIDCNDLEDDNELVIIVANTAANAFVGFEPPAEWETKHIGPYHERCTEFERTLMDSGLYGPVKLYEGK